MIPPSIWLRAPSGLITRPTSWIATTFSTTHLAGADVDRDLGELDPEREHAHAGRVRAAGALAEDLAVAEQAGDLARAASEPPSDETIWPPFSESSRSSRSKRCAASSITCRAASAAAERTAGPIDGSVDEPPETTANGPRAESPS